MATSSTNFGILGRASVDIDIRLDRMTAEIRKGERQVRRSASIMERSINGFERSVKTATRAVIGLTGVLGVREVIRYGDAWIRVNTQLSTVTKTTEELTNVTEQLFDVAQETGTPIETLASLYARFARNSEELANDQDRLVGIVRTLSQAIVTSGIASSEASAGLLQLTQGFAKGRLDGDELRSVLENLPPVAKAIANELNVTVGALRDLGAEGAITQDVLIRAFDAIGPEVNRAFVGIDRTAAQAFTALENSITRVIGAVNEQSGATDALVRAIDAVAEALEDPAITGFFSNVITPVIGGTERLVAVLGEVRNILKGIVTFIDELAALPFAAINKLLGNTTDELITFAELVEKNRLNDLITSARQFEDSLRDTADATREVNRELTNLEKLAEVIAELPTAERARLAELAEQVVADLEIAEQALVEAVAAAGEAAPRPPELTRDEAKEENAAERRAQALDEAKDKAREFAVVFGSALEDTILQTESLTDAVRQLGVELARVALRQAITQGISAIFAGGTTPTNQGTGGVVNTATGGGIVTRPTFLPTMATGGVIAGERGREAIIPLERMLGRGFSFEGGGQQTVQVIDQRGAGAPAIEQRTVNGPGGAEVLQLVIREQVAGMFRDGSIDPLMGQMGVRRPGTRRG